MITEGIDSTVLFLYMGLVGLIGISKNDFGWFMFSLGAGFLSLCLILLIDLFMIRQEWRENV